TLAGRPVSLVVLHHENTAGRVSGAWTGRPDVLLHVTAQGNGTTRLRWQKAKWSSSLHRTTTQLRWLEHEGFELAESEATRAERVSADIAGFVLAHGGCSSNDIEKGVTGDARYLRQRRDAMLEEGVLSNAGGKTGFKLWHRDDPPRPASDAELRWTADAP